MKSSIAVTILASCAGIAAACSSDVYEHCTHYIPRSDSDRYIACSSVNQCIDACKARTGKCEKAYQNGEIAVSCAKLIGNMNEYCVAFETTCKTRFGSSSEFDLASVETENEHPQVALSDLEGAFQQTSL